MVSYSSSNDTIWQELKEKTKEKSKKNNFIGIDLINIAEQLMEP